MLHPTGTWRTAVAILLLPVSALAQPPEVRAGADETGAAQAGAAPTAATTSLAGPLSLRDAIERGLTHHLTILGLGHAVAEARGGERVAQSALRPNLSGEVSAAEQKVNLSALGVRLESPLPGIAVPDVAGPFGVLDARARVTQAVVDLPALHAARAARETRRATELTLEDARQAIAQAIGTAYFDVLAARAKRDAARAQLDTATAIHERAGRRQAAGMATALDMKRAQVQVLVERQRLVALDAGLAKRRIALARAVGLPPGAQFDLAHSLAFTPAPPLALDQALAQAAARRTDLQAAEARWRAAERAQAAARAARLPSVAVTADYGASRSTGHPWYATYAVIGALRVPIWLGGRTQGEVDRATATLDRRRAEADDLRAQIESEVRTAFVDLEAAASQVEVSVARLEVVRESLGLARQRFETGLEDNVSVVQAQQALASAELDSNRQPRRLQPGDARPRARRRHSRRRPRASAPEPMTMPAPTRSRWSPARRSMAVVLGSAVLIAVSCRTQEPAALSIPDPRTAARAPSGGIGALGRIEPGDGIVRIAARSLSGQASIVARVLVGEGDAVRAGQPLAELDSRSQLQAAADQAAARVEVARRRLAQVQAGARPSDIAAQMAEVERLQAELAQAEQEHQRFASLGANVTALELDRLRLRVEATRRTLTAAEQRLAGLREVRDVDLSLVQAELAEAIRNETRVRAEHEASIVRAPADGRVLEIHARPGEIVGADGLMEIAPAGPLYAVAEVPEADVARVRVGQRATVSGDGLEQPVEGTVERIGTRVIEHRLMPVDPARFSDARIVEVRVRLDDSRAVAGRMHLRVEVVIQP